MAMANDPRAAPRLHLRLLGPVAFAFTTEDPLRFATRKALALMIYLAVTARRHHREALIELLWPASDAVHGRLSLRRSLTTIRQALGEGAQDSVTAPQAHRLQTHGDMVWLTLLPGDHSDLHDFTAAAQLPVRLSSLSTLQATLALYRDAFCADLAVDDAPEFGRWLTTQRAMVEAQFATLCSSLIHFYLDELGETAPAIALARQWVAHQPWHEPAQQYLLTALLAADEPAQALAVGTAYQARLAAELGLEPTAAMNALIARAQRASAVPLPRPAVDGVPDVLLPFAGRAEEVRRLRLAYRTASQGQLNVLVLTGVAGMGKSRLLTHFMPWCASQGADLLVGHAFEAGGRLPYQALVAALRPRIEREHAPDDLLDDVWLIELSRLLPEVRGRYPDLPPPTGMDDQALFEAIAQLLVALARRAQAHHAACVLVLDDAQWLDVGSRDLLRYLLRRGRAAGAAILLVLALRAENLATDPTLAQWVGDLQREAPLERCPLESLSADAIQTLTQTLLDVPHSTPLGAWLFTVTDGQPFYLTETVRELIERHEIMRDAMGRWALTQPDWAPPASPAPISRTIHEVIQLHLSRVQPTTQRFLQAAAVVGNHFTFAAIADIADIPAAEAGIAALEEGLAHHLVHQTVLIEGGHAPADAEAYAFRHDLIREVIYQGLSAVRRRWLHERALRVHQAQGAAPAILAHHALAARIPALAFEQSVLAGEAALGVLAMGDAIAHLEQARQLLREANATTPAAFTVAASDLSNLHLTLAQAYALAERGDEARQVYADLRAIGRATHDPAMEVMALNHHATLLMQQRAFDLATAITLLEEALQCAAEAQQPLLSAETEWNLCQAKAFAWDVAAALRHGHHAQELAQGQQQMELAARCAVALSSTYVFGGRYDEALRFGQEGAEHYERLIQRANTAARGIAGTFAWGGLPPTPLSQLQAMVVSALTAWGFAALNLGHITTSQALLQQAHATALAARNDFAQTFADLNLPHALLEAGDYEAAWHLTHETLTRRFQERHFLVTARHNVVVCLALFGRFAEAQQLLDEALSFAQEPTLAPHHLLLLNQRVIIHALQGEWGAAVQWAHAASDLRQRAPYELWWTEHDRHLETRALPRAGEADRARQQIERVQREVGPNRYQGIVLRRMQAELARHKRAPDEALQRLQAALTLAQELGMPRAQWQILADMAGVWQVQGRTNEAAVALTQAEAISDQLARRITDPALQAEFRAAALPVYRRCF